MAWTCGKCTYLNTGARLRACEMCKTERGTEGPAGNGCDAQESTREQER